MSIHTFNNLRGKPRQELTLSQFVMAAGRQVGSWQWKLLPSFTSMVEGTTTYKEKEWYRTEKDWWIIFDQFCEQQPRATTNRSVKHK